MSLRPWYANANLIRKARQSITAFCEEIKEIEVALLETEILTIDMILLYLGQIWSRVDAVHSAQDVIICWLVTPIRRIIVLRFFATKTVLLDVSQVMKEARHDSKSPR